MSEEKSVSGYVKKSYETFCGILLFVAVSMGIFEIIGRTLFNFSYDFVIDLSVWLTVWAMLLMVGPLLPQGRHVSIEFLREKLRGKLRLSVSIFNNFFTLAYGAVITLGGILFIQRYYVEKTVFARFFAIPMWIVEICVPIGMFVFTIYALITFVKDVCKKW